MKTARKLLLLVLIALMALAMPGAALAATPTPDEFVIGDNYVLKSGETLADSLFVLGGNAELEQDSVVKGDVVVIGGNLSADGGIRGHILILGGYVQLGANAVVDGNITTMGGSLNKDPEAQVKGDITSESAGSMRLVLPGQVFVPSAPVVYPHTLDALWWLWLPVATLVMAALAMIVVMFWPKPIERAGKAVVSQPLVAGGMGLITMLASPFVLVALILTLLLIPLAPVAALALIVTAVFGWVVLGAELGKRLAEVFKQDWHPALSAGLGTFALTFVAMGVDKILICVGWILPFLVTALGLGAVILTRYGTREYPMTFAPPMPPAVPPAVPPAAAPSAAGETS